MRFPDFLVIGAMKAGTTTLWADLRQHPCLFLPEEKEPSNLRYAEVVRSKGRRRYAKLFSRAKSDQLCGEASTYYTMLPDISGVAERAWGICGSRLMIVYVMRNPIERAISHHWHSFVAGDMPKNINEAVVQDPRLINYSLYARQLRPWIGLFGRSNVHLIKMEDYVAHRQNKFNEVCDFLGVPTFRIDSSRIHTAYNSRESLVRLNDLGKRVSSLPFYRTHIRPFLSLSIRRKAKVFLSRNIQKDIEGPSLNTLQIMANKLNSDYDALTSWVDFPLWDLEATIERLSYNAGQQTIATICREDHRV